MLNIFSLNGKGILCKVQCLFRLSKSADIFDDRKTVRRRKMFYGNDGC